MEFLSHKGPVQKVYGLQLGAGSGPVMSPSPPRWEAAALRSLSPSTRGVGLVLHQLVWMAYSNTLSVSSNKLDTSRWKNLSYVLA